MPGSLLRRSLADITNQSHPIEHAVHVNPPTTSKEAPPAPESPSRRPDESLFVRAESKRRSISSSLSTMFGRGLSSSSPSQTSSVGGASAAAALAGSAPRRPMFTEGAYWSQSATLRAVLNAVILDEWVRELAALCEEHALRLSADHYEDDTYIRTVAL